MLYGKTNILVSMTLTAAMLLVTGTASGAATKVPVFGSQTTVGVIDPGIEWVDAEGTTHVRGRVLRVEFFGDLEGIVIQRLSFNMDQFGNGDLHGSAAFTGTLVGVGAGELTGRFAGDIVGGVFSGDSIGHGTLGGAKAQSRLTTTGVLGSGVATYGGSILFPRGR